jgi:uncharacterized protein (TIGR02757 family)
MLSQAVITQLRNYASLYETQDFLNGDPSWFMHQVKGRANQEVTAFVAAALSYGSRQQFMPKIEQLLQSAGGDLYHWILNGKYEAFIPDVQRCFYRLYTYKDMRRFLTVLQSLLLKYGSIGRFAKMAAQNVHEADSKGLKVLEELSEYFWSQNVPLFVPRPHSSACKRPCMFLRWMVRDKSPVDLGLWTSFIPKTSLFIPLDTHVLQMANRLGVLQNKTAGWSAVVKLTTAMKQVFPDDPARADFALFGFDTDIKT